MAIHIPMQKKITSSSLQINTSYKYNKTWFLTGFTNAMSRLFIGGERLSGLLLQREDEKGGIGLCDTGASVLSTIKEGDVVARNSYNRDIYFKVVRLYTGEDGKLYACLKGLDLRLEASAPLDDLVRVEPPAVSRYWEKGQVEYTDRINYTYMKRDESRQRRLRLAINSHS